MMPPVWLLKAWLWLRQNWRWVLFPIGILLLVLGWTRRTNVTIASSSLREADQNARKLADEAAAKTLEAGAARDVKIVEADRALDADLAVVVDRQRADAPAMAQDPDALNQALLAVGKRQRGPS